jgi:hypothetical protein
VSWTPEEQRAVTQALLGTWPSQVASWEREGIVAYLAELQAREMSAEQALTAIRARSDRFPPSAGELAAEARKDPSRPTFEELLDQLYGPGGVFGFKRSNVTISPWVTAFADGFGRDRLRMLALDDPDDGKWRRRELEDAWSRFLEASEGRAAHEIASRSGRGTLGRINPLAAIEAGRS